MRFELHIYHHFCGAEDFATLPPNIEARLGKIARTLIRIEEKQMKTQADIDALTGQVRAGTSVIQAAIEAESAEIQAAIASSDLDTTELETAVAANAELAAAVSGIFTPENQSPEDETPDDEGNDGESESEF